MLSCLRGFGFTVLTTIGDEYLFLSSRQHECWILTQIDWRLISFYVRCRDVIISWIFHTQLSREYFLIAWFFYEIRFYFIQFLVLIDTIHRLDSFCVVICLVFFLFANNLENIRGLVRVLLLLIQDYFRNSLNLIFDQTHSQTQWLFGQFSINKLEVRFEILSRKVVQFGAHRLDYAAKTVADLVERVRVQLLRLPGGGLWRAETCFTLIYVTNVLLLAQN